MTDSDDKRGVVNPHDKLFRETWSDVNNARGFLKHYLPEQVLKMVDLSSLEISKDSFIEKELSDYYSDMLYKVEFSRHDSGFIYVLFEHKSYYDRYVHLQLLEYMVRIWRLYIKQSKKKPTSLPLVIPLLICHGRREWPKDKVRLSSLLSGPVDELGSYVPDFGFELYDLSGFPDDEIKGTIMTRVVMLMFKHVFNPDLRKKLPEIFSLLKILVVQETGLQYLETVMRYLSSVLEEETLAPEEIKRMAEQAISKDAGGYMVTLAEKWRNEGKIEGLKDAIELGLTIKFPENSNTVMGTVKQIYDLDLLVKLKEAVKTSRDISEILILLPESETE